MNKWYLTFILLMDNPYWIDLYSKRRKKYFVSNQWNQQQAFSAQCLIFSGWCWVSKKWLIQLLPRANPSENKILTPLRVQNFTQTGVHPIQLKNMWIYRQWLFWYKLDCLLIRKIFKWITNALANHWELTEKKIRGGLKSL